MNTNEQIIRRLFQYFNERQWDQIAGLYDDKVALLHPFKKDGYIIKNKWNILLRYAALQRKYAEVVEDIVLIESSGNQVFVQYVTHGKDKTGKDYSLPAWTIYTLEQGKIVKDVSYISTPATRVA